MNDLILSSRYTLVKRLIAIAIIIGALSYLPTTAQDNSVTIGSTQLKEDAVLWLVPSGNSGQQGLILPVTAKEGFTPSEKGMVIYDPSDDKVYYWNGTDWQDLVGSGSTSLNSISDLPDVDASGVATGQVLKWNGSTWVPGSDEAGGGGVGSDDQQLTFDEGTKVLSIENGNGVDLSSLLSGGGADNWGTQVVEKDNSLEGDGTAGSPMGLASQGASSGQVLKWNGSGWVPANDDGGTAGATYSAGDGILIDGANVISNSGDADADPTNEIDVTFQTGLLVGDGSAVSGLNGTSDGQVPKWDAGSSSWVAGTDQTGGGGSSVWTENGGDIHYDAGNVGIGLTAPRAPLDIFTNTNIPINLETGSTNNFISFSNTIGYRGYLGIWTGDNDMDFGTAAGNNIGKVHLTTNATPKLTVAADGKVGIGTIVPRSTLDVKGGNWDLGSTEGDLRIGDDNYRLKMSTSTGGAGAGNARIRAQGGSNNLLLGAGTEDVLSITPGSVNMAGDFANQAMYQVYPPDWTPPSTHLISVPIPGASISVNVPEGSKVFVGFGASALIDSDRVWISIFRDETPIRFMQQDCYDIAGSKEVWGFDITQLDMEVTPGLHTYRVSVLHSDDGDDGHWDRMSFYAIVLKE